MRATGAKYASSLIVCLPTNKEDAEKAKQIMFMNKIYETEHVAKYYSTFPRAPYTVWRIIGGCKL